MGQDSHGFRKSINIKPRTGGDLSDAGDLGVDAADSNALVYNNGTGAQPVILEADLAVTDAALAAHIADTAEHGATGAVVGTTNTQTLTNKTLTAPVINSPTGIVKGDVGLGNVDNTSDANKPVSTAQATAIATVQSDIDAHEANTSNPHSVTKAQVGLSNVDNTSDATKDAATATLTNKTIAAGSNTISGLTNSNLSGTAAITNANLADVATATFKGRTTGGTGAPEDLTATQATALLNVVGADSGSGGVKGLAPATGAGDAAAGKFLKADATWAVPAPAVANLAVTSIKTTTYAIATSDDVVRGDSSGGAFTATLPTAVGVSGKQYDLVQTGATSANALTIATTSSQTFSHTGATTLKLYSKNERFRVVSDGANWVVLEHYVPSEWVNLGAVTITGTTSNPTKGSVAQDKLWVRRIGDSAHFRLDFSYTSAGTAGSGDYKFAIPTTYPIDTTKVAVVTTVIGSAAFVVSGVGDAAVSYQGTSNAKGFVVPYDANNVRLGMLAGTGSPTFVCSASYAITGTHGSIMFEFTVPIAGWEP